MILEDCHPSLKRFIYKTSYTASAGVQSSNATLLANVLQLENLTIPLDSIISVSESTKLAQRKRVHLCVEYIHDGQRVTVVAKSMQMRWRLAHEIRKAIVKQKLVTLNLYRKHYWILESKQICHIVWKL